METVLFIIELLLLGAAVGVISAALGVGGGILMVPAFLEFVPGMDPHTAKGTSLFIIIFVSLLNVWRLRHQGERGPWALALTMALGSIAGGYFGGWVTQFWSDGAVAWVFTAVVAMLGLRTLFLRDQPGRGDAPARHPLVVAPAIGAVTGVISGMTGVGGGLVLVPLSLMAGIVRNERVVLLSNTVMVATAVASTVAHLQAPRTVGPDAWQVGFIVGQVSLAVAPLVFLASQAGAPAGKWINARLTLERRRYVMGGLLLLIALRLIWRQMG